MSSSITAGDSTAQPTILRASDPHTAFAGNLGPLTELAGTWVGSGLNVMALPNRDNRKPSTGPKDFRVQVNATRETLSFTPIGSAVPNRGAVASLGAVTGQNDIELFGLTYLQRVSDAATNAALHIEPGIWLNVPPTDVPPVADATVARLATIPHGNSLLAQSTAVVNLRGGPVINAVDTRPTGPAATPAMWAQFASPPSPPPDVPLPWVINPNLALVDALAGQDFNGTVAIIISTMPIGGIVNIPFVTANAEATNLHAIFWIETVRQPDGSSFMQLQYTQTVILRFLGIDWRHISVATLVKQ